MWEASMICRMLLRSVVSRTWSLARVNAGNSSPARMAMIAMTTNSSIKVKAMAIRVAERLLGFMINKHIGAGLYVNDASGGTNCSGAGGWVAAGSGAVRPTRRVVNIQACADMLVYHETQEPLCDADRHCLHFDRTIGRHRDHRHPRRTAVASVNSSQRPGPAHHRPQQHPANHARFPHVRR